MSMAREYIFRVRLTEDERARLKQYAQSKNVEVGSDTRLLQKWL
jgi:hypothetical protein